VTLSNRSKLLMASTLILVGCSHIKPIATGDEKHEVKFEEVLITGDLALEKLNDEELFAAATSFFAAEDFAQAARYFGRLADFHQKSIHRRAALYNAGLSLEKLKLWEEAHQRFLELSDPAKGTGDSLDAAFRVAETLYHQARFDEAVVVLRVIGGREDLPINKRMEARVQQGICELESGQADVAEMTLRKVMSTWQGLADKDLVDEYFPAQAQFFMGEIYRIHYEAVTLDADKTSDQLAKDVEYKAELLLSAQGHYLRAIRIGNGYWATAAGAQIGGLYENLYDHMMHAPAPSELNKDEGAVYSQELRKKIRILITKAITVYERTLEAAERIGASSPFVEKTRDSLKRMKDMLLADAKAEEETQLPAKVPHG
jgi:tetratricopeptide (TPR) repeat protein